ncbi:SDR family oxidoreductase [Synechococcus sp. PCC 6312]|uniref:SDR family oxidoreductase n=1 Tax=Synechococcus sp. (strain ATCC 27167 / PCC 6312) TaxID=195253 RepID=UPI00029F0522|nr:SDR family oxidoreductase [Synechococcus sp. PCC 6312]AFY61397.1 short-chain dehydrogenase of unknown substrate specificity [Synechococcus sp. PCC 6312]
MNISGSVALITGANGGIGSIFVQELLKLDVSKIYACARDVSKLNQLVALDSHRVIPVELNVVNAEAVARVAKDCSDVSLLINNAGTSLNQGLIAAADLEAARLEMELNYFGVLSMCRAFAPVLKAQGGGAIVNILSLLGKINLPFSGSYSASKAAAFSMTQGIRAELMGQGTLVIGVMPGTVNTELAKDWPDPKVEPTEVVKDTLQAVIDGQEDVFPGEQAQQIASQLLTDPKGVEKYLGNFLPGLSLAGL